ncbi:Protein OS-9 [Ciborinia camelliae]|nr:Protein OS-9 [Ciborinia camelliae]
MMRQLISVSLAAAFASTALASQNVFSVNDDLFAFPQYEVVFSDSFLSEQEADFIINHPSSPIHDTHTPQSSIPKSIQSSQYRIQENPSDHGIEPSEHTHELMWLHGEAHLCTIPIVSLPPRNETSEAEARAAEQKELARATDRGWELLEALEGDCLYFVSGWWSYSFCYNNEITQFHQLAQHPGRPKTNPQPDPSAQEFVLGKAKPSPKSKSTEDEWGNQIEAQTEPKTEHQQKTELQIKGDTRYLVQKMEGGTICDLTGKPRQVEVQFHCNPHVVDRIGYIKEMTTCSYLMVVYTPRLCDDVAFLPPKAEKANSIICKPVIPASDLPSRIEAASAEAEASASGSSSIPSPSSKPINIGGITVGAGNFIGKEGQRLPIPTDFGDGDTQVEIIARAKSRAEGGEIEVASEQKLAKMDLDPKMLEKLMNEVKKLAGDKGWRIEVVDVPGHVREILGVVDEDGDPGGGDHDDNDGEEGSEEVFKDEL